MKISKMRVFFKFSKNLIKSDSSSFQNLRNIWTIPNISKKEEFQARHKQKCLEQNKWKSQNIANDAVVDQRREKSVELYADNA